MRFQILGCLLAFGVAGCNDIDRNLHDFYNRTYHYGEEIPLKPFVIKLVKAEYANVDGKIRLKIFLNVLHRSAETESLSRNRFVLRAGRSQVERDPTLLETVGLDSISFAPTEEAMVTIPFTLSNESLQEKLSLIVDHQEKRGRVYLTLIEVKGEWLPKSPPEPGVWRTASSPRWE